MRGGSISSAFSVGGFASGACQAITRQTPGLLLYCRSGFEADCAAEIESVAAEHGAEGRCEYTRNHAFVLWIEPTRRRGVAHAWRPELSELVFARQWFGDVRRAEGVRAPDRVTPLVEAARGFGAPFSAVWLEAPDSELGRKTLGTMRGIVDPLESALRETGLLGAGKRRSRLHVCFLDAATVLLGISDPRTSSPWPMGIPRLKAPSGAPSRSGLKLIEALHYFIGEQALPTRMRAGRVAIDLGAAPGGWSKVLSSRGVRVVAVDNGPIAAEVLATQLVEHRRADAFRYRPERPVDWMVCDVVAAPARVAALAAQWIARGWCRETIFNLKLPNAQRWQEILRCRTVVENTLAQVSGRHELRIKHLYHDREEVTAHLRRD